MYSSSALIDALKASKGIATDTDLAAILDISKQNLSQYRSGLRVFSDVTAHRIAEESGIDAAQAVMGVNAERAARDGHAALHKIYATAAFLFSRDGKIALSMAEVIGNFAKIPGGGAMDN